MKEFNILSGISPLNLPTLRPHEILRKRRKKECKSQNGLKTLGKQDFLNMSGLMYIRTYRDSGSMCRAHMGLHRLSPKAEKRNGHIPPS